MGGESFSISGWVQFQTFDGKSECSGFSGMGNLSKMSLWEIRAMAQRFIFPNIMPMLARRFF